ncbi:hypothetical protein ACL02U_09675 [Streptomyces sp. MS06]
MHGGVLVAEGAGVEAAKVVACAQLVTAGWRLRAHQPASRM